MRIPTLLRGALVGLMVQLLQHDASQERYWGSSETCREQGRDIRFYLEDLAVGQRFTTGSHELDEAQIKAFAAEFDPQPFHLDAEIAKTTLFDGLVASACHTAAITMRLLVTSGIPLAWGMIGAECSLRWPNPARPGDISPFMAR